MKIIKSFKKLFSRPEQHSQKKKEEKKPSYDEMCLHVFPPDDWGVFDVEWGLPSTYEILMLLLADVGPGEQSMERRPKKKSHKEGRDYGEKDKKLP